MLMSRWNVHTRFVVGNCVRLPRHSSRVITTSPKFDTPEEQRFVCPDRSCDATFDQRASMSRHVRAAHAGLDSKLYTCTFAGCSYVTPLKGTLAQHQFVHTSARPVACDQCSMTFKSRAHLKSHMRWHSDSRPYACRADASCVMKFKTSAGRSAHERTHSADAKRYRCEHEGCSFNTLQRQNLERHKRIHVRARLRLAALSKLARPNR